MTFRLILFFALLWHTTLLADEHDKEIDSIALNCILDANCYGLKKLTIETREHKLLTIPQYVFGQNALESATKLSLKSIRSIANTLSRTLLRLQGLLEINLQIGDDYNIIVMTVPVPAPDQSSPSTKYPVIFVRFSQDIFFDFSSSDVNMYGLAIIQDFLTELSKESHQLKDIVIVGHTDNVGTEVENMVLSNRRAENVAELLQRQADRVKFDSLINIETFAAGESQPVHAFQVETRSAENRRVEFFLSDVSGIGRNAKSYMDCLRSNRNKPELCLQHYKLLK